jgi:hypothetical protein
VNCRFLCYAWDTTDTSQALWIDKISFGAVRQMAEHFFVYLAELVVTAVVRGSTVPWLFCR